MPGPGLKISVVVPAYNSVDTLERLMESIDAQTLSKDEFEVVVVDDGSTDGTFQLLQAMQQSRPNLIAHRIDPSGWASRPRNVGVELASGDYVLYMDSDDTLYPDALRRCHEYATEHGADILNPKESQSNQPAWGMAPFRKNVPNLVGGAGIAGLLPMTPHKMFRRAFLQEHGLHFEEAPAGRRILWEDVRMVLAAYKAARVVSVLADTPVYHWHSNAGSISKSYGAHSAEFWDQVEGLLQYIWSLFPGDRYRAEREAMLLQQYKVRLLGRFTTFAMHASPDEMALPFARLQELQRQYMPEELDAALGILDRGRALLVRADRLDLLLLLVAFDKGIRNSAAVVRAEWEGEALHVISRTTWARKGGVAFVEEDGRIVRALPEEVAAALPRELVDVTDELGAVQAAVWVRDPARMITWAIPTTWSTRFITTKAGNRTVEVVTSARLDLRSAEFGRTLEVAAWDLWIEIDWIGALRRSRMRFTGAPRAVACEHRLAVARPNDEDKLAVDLDPPAALALSAGAPPASGRVGSASALRIPLPGITRGAGTDIPVEAVVASATGGRPGTLRGRLITAGSGVAFSGSFDGEPGRYELRGPIELVVGRNGRARLTTARQPWTRARVRSAVTRRLRALGV